MQLAADLWVSPWRHRISDGKLFHLCSVARSRKERKQRHVEIVVSDEQIRAMPYAERKPFLAQQIVQAGQALQLVKV